MADTKQLNARGNYDAQFGQGVGGWAEYTVLMTRLSEQVRHDVQLPPKKVIPVIFLPGVMGSNLRMSRLRQRELDRTDSRSWRPDDMMDIGGQIGTLSGKGLGGWYKDATPAQRQMALDPNQTEVEYYHYTESDGRFDPDGVLTRESDGRHRNVPDTLRAIPPLLGRDMPSGRGNSMQWHYRKSGSPAQIARWRGWSEVLFEGAYGDMLKLAEARLNNMFLRDAIHPDWAPMLKDPRTFGARDCPALTPQDLQKIRHCWYPVHAMGYNFLKSNGDSAKAIAERIRGMVRGYQKRGFDCREVIVVTHSMGGLVGRALLHPSYGNLLKDPTVKVLGMYHNVMPSAGAAATYKRMRFGFQDKPGAIEEIKARVVGIDGEHATAVLANSCAPLELLPGQVYGKEWIIVEDSQGRKIWSWPNTASPLENIYLKPENVWWRLINPKWVNPANALTQDGGGLKNVFDRLLRAQRFLDSITDSFHPENSYISYCASNEFSAYGEVVFRLVDAEPLFDLPPVEMWKLIADDARGRLTVGAGHRNLTLQLQPSRAGGDETVPALRSAAKVKGRVFIHGCSPKTGYEHQNSYSDKHVLTSMLYAIACISKSANWG